MSATIPGDGYGEVNWVDYVDNWRDVDATWLQERSIVRNAADPAGTPAEGRVFYNAAKHALRLRNSSSTYTTLVGSNNIAIVDGSPTSEIKSAAGTAAAGTGITFNNSNGSMSLGRSSFTNGIVLNIDLRSHITSPTIGQMIYETNTGSFLVYYGATTGWRPPWNQSWGILDRATVSTDQSISSTTIANITDLSISTHLLSDRYYRATLSMYITGNASATNRFTSLILTNGAGSTTFGTFPQQFILAQDNMSYCATSTFTSSTIGTVLKVGYALAGTNAIIVKGGAGNASVSELVVEDLGSVVGSTPPNP